MTEPKTPKTVDKHYSDIMTSIELAIGEVSPIAGGMLIASLRQGLSTMEKRRKGHLDEPKLT